MFANLKKLFSLLSPSQRRNLFLLQFLVIFMAFAEIASVFSIGPFIALIGNLDQLNGDGLIAEAYKFSGITDQNNFIIAFGAALSNSSIVAFMIPAFRSNSCNRVSFFFCLAPIVIAITLHSFKSS